jgi:hypothetical protein
MLGAPRPILHGGYTEAGNRTPRYNAGKLPNSCDRLDEQVVSHS